MRGSLRKRHGESVSNSYYVRIRGSVHGPFTEETFVKLARAGKVSRAHQISLDGKQWQSAQDFPHLFAGRKQESKPQDITTSSPAAPAAAPEAAKQWYYTSGGQQKGPLTEQDLRALTAAGGISSQEQVWTQGLAEWVPIASATPFRTLFVTPTDQNEPSRSTAITPSDSNTLPPETLHQLIASLGWVWFVVAVGFLASLGTLCLAIWIASQALNVRVNTFLLPALYTLSACGVVFTGTFLLNGYASRLTELKTARNLESYLKAVAWLNRFWCFVAVVLIVVLAFGFFAFISAMGIAFPVR
jgi:hypothetical protein